MRSILAKILLWSLVTFALSLVALPGHFQGPGTARPTRERPVLADEHDDRGRRSPRL